MSVDTTTFKNCRILVVGDLMIDEYVWGDVSRISPEAPVQVVSVTNETDTLGGAGNVVNNLVQLGAQVCVAGVIGSGPDGQRMRDLLKRPGIDARGVISDPQRPTTRKTRVLAANQQVLRIDRENKNPTQPKAYAQLKAYVLDTIEQVDAILISDYAKGIVTADLVTAITEKAIQQGIPTIADPKGIDFSKYAGVDVITPNQKEASFASGIEIRGNQSLEKAARRIQKENGLKSLLVTCGKHGMVLFEPHQAPYRIYSRAQQVFDVSGAGDTVVAVFGLAVASGATHAEAAQLANTAAGIVVGKIGTATVTPQELQTTLSKGGAAAIPKCLPLPQLAEQLQKLRASGKRIVLTNGCFDLLHVGHIQLLTAAKKMGDILVVALDDDASVARIKGTGRPILKADERVNIISSLDCVDYVVVFDGDALPDLLRQTQPDILVKGSNYRVEEVSGYDLIQQQGGRVALVDLTGNISTSRIIDAIRNQSV